MGVIGEWSGYLRAAVHVGSWHWWQDGARYSVLIVGLGRAVVLSRPCVAGCVSCWCGLCMDMARPHLTVLGKGGPSTQCYGACLDCCLRRVLRCLYVAASSGFI